MTLLTVPHCSVTNTVSPERGTSSGVAPLDPFLYQRMRFCARCAGEEIFIDVFECEFGRLGVCLGCGKEKLIPFSREVAA
jgi:hypothetical protein